MKASTKLLPTWRPSFSTAAFVTVPLMKVMSEGDGLQVSFSEPLVNAVVTVTVWKRGEELQVTFLPSEFLSSFLLPSLAALLSPGGCVHGTTGADAAAHPRPAGGRPVLRQSADPAGKTQQQQHRHAVCHCHTHR